MARFKPRKRGKDAKAKAAKQSTAQQKGQRAGTSQTPTLARPSTAQAINPKPSKKRRRAKTSKNNDGGHANAASVSTSHDKVRAVDKDKAAAVKAAQRAKARHRTKQNRSSASGTEANTAIGGSGFSMAVTYPAPLSVLVVGDGDFSFSKGLLAHRHGDPSGLVCTSYDSRREVELKYPKATVNIDKLSGAGVVVCHDIDAMRLGSFKGLLARRRKDAGHEQGDSELFDRIVFNFPHVGLQRVHVNRQLVRKFLASAQDLLSPNGQIHTTLKLKPPYSLWNVEGIAADEGLEHMITLDFDQRLFPGYRHMTTKADAKTFRAASDNEARHCKTLVFVKAAR